MSITINKIPLILAILFLSSCRPNGQKNMGSYDKRVIEHAIDISGLQDIYPGIKADILDYGENDPGFDVSILIEDLEGDEENYIIIEEYLKTRYQSYQPYRSLNIYPLLNQLKITRCILIKYPNLTDRELKFVLRYCKKEGFDFDKAESDLMLPRNSTILAQLTEFRAIINCILAKYPNLSNNELDITLEYCKNEGFSFDDVKEDLISEGDSGILDRLNEFREEKRKIKTYILTKYPNLSNRELEVVLEYCDDEELDLDNVEEDLISEEDSGILNRLNEFRIEENYQAQEEEKAETQNNNGNEEKCIICLESKLKTEELQFLGCHTFHKSCIDPWVNGGHNKCPICRRKHTYKPRRERD